MTLHEQLVYPPAWERGRMGVGVFARFQHMPGIRQWDPREQRTGSRPVPQYGTRIRDRGPPLPAMAVRKIRRCVLRPCCTYLPRRRGMSVPCQELAKNEQKRHARTL